MKIVATFSNLAEAGFAQSMLIGNGVAAELHNVESSVNLAGGVPLIHVVVADEDAAQASALVQPLTMPAIIPPKTMKIPDSEYSLLKAIIKGIALLQVISGLSDFVVVLLETTGIRAATAASISRANEYTVWGFYHFAIAAIFFVGANFLGRLLTSGSDPVSGAAVAAPGQPPHSTHPAGGTS